MLFWTLDSKKIAWWSQPTELNNSFTYFKTIERKIWYFHGSRKRRLL